MGCGASSEAGGTAPVPAAKSPAKPAVQQPAKEDVAASDHSAANVMSMLARSASSTTKSSMKTKGSLTKGASMKIDFSEALQEEFDDELDSAPADAPPRLAGGLRPLAQSALRRLDRLLNLNRERLEGMVGQFDGDKGFMNEKELGEFMDFFIEDLNPADIAAVAAALVKATPDGRVTAAALLAGTIAVAASEGTHLGASFRLAEKHEEEEEEKPALAAFAQKAEAPAAKTEAEHEVTEAVEAAIDAALPTEEPSVAGGGVAEDVAEDDTAVALEAPLEAEHSVAAPSEGHGMAASAADDEMAAAAAFGAEDHKEE